MHRRSIAAALALSVLAASAAQATVVGGTITGTIDGNTFDTYGIFGARVGNLSGQPLIAGYSYDTTLASYLLQPGWDAWVGTGGLSLSVTIGGVTAATARRRCPFDRTGSDDALTAGPVPPPRHVSRSRSLPPLSPRSTGPPRRPGPRELVPRP